MRLTQSAPPSVPPVSLLTLLALFTLPTLRTLSEHDGKAARNMSRLRNFRRFYLSVVCYVYFTRIIS
jgi:hypothetical protein